MTTNQTIDGVPRADLKEIYAQMVDYWERINGELGPCGITVDESMDKGDLPALAKLRALLDANKVNSRQMGLMQFVDAHPIKSAAQPQGEPVAYVMMTNGKQRTFACSLGFTPGELEIFRGIGAEVVPLYAEQRAPVAIK